MSNADNRQAHWRTVAMPTAALLLLLGLLVGTILHVSTSRSDWLARQRQNHLVGLVITQSMTAVANDQEASTFWDDAVLRTRQRPLDMEWLDNNLGVWFHTYYQHDETYILDPADRPIYAMQFGSRSQPNSFRKIETQARPLIKKLRGTMGNGYLAPDGAAGQTIGASSIAAIAGRPAIISLKPIVSETGAIAQSPGSEYLHVSIRYLDGTFLDRLSSLYGIDKPRFKTFRDGPGAFPILGSDRALLGYINWSPFEPGRQVEDKMAPVLILAMLVVGILVGLLLLHLRKGRLELEASRAHAQHLAFHDSLTGLPNRALFEDRLEHALARRDRRVGVMLLDLDRFKNVNDTLGHLAGDALIRDFGLRLSALTREADTIARLGGDEFAILVEQTEIGDLSHLADRIVKDIARPFELLGSQAYVGVSIGMAICTEAAMDRLELIRRADIALYRVKDDGGNHFRLFSPDLDAGIQLRGCVEEELREALDTDEGLRLEYQPQVDRRGEIVGLEALIRWRHPVRGLIPPEQFIPVAEESGLIVPLGEWALREACIVTRRWPKLFVSINVSSAQLRSAGFADNSIAIVRSIGANPRNIQLEVTERVLIEDDDVIKAGLSRLRATGFKIVLDDFGTGYSSLGYLRSFAVDKIKIDQSFIQHLGDASNSEAIVGAILALGRAMGLSVAAEGVETEAQRTFLDVVGCREMQGYFFSGAVAEDELDALLATPGPSSAAIA